MVTRNSRRLIKVAWNVIAGSGSDTNDRNPLDDIAVESERINLNHGVADTMAMNQVTYTALASNTFLRGFQQMWQQHGPGLRSITLLGDLRIILDNDIAVGEAFLVRQVSIDSR